MTTVLTARHHNIQLYLGTDTEKREIPGSWKTFTGGGIKNEATFNRPGGMADRQAIGGVAERENITLTREYDYVRDAGLIGPGGTLDQAVEAGADIMVVVQRITKADNVVSQRTFKGTIIRAADAELDSESGNVQIMTVECTAL